MQLNRDIMKRLVEAQVLTEEQTIAIESFCWQEDREGEHSKTLPFVRFLLELGGSLLLIGLTLGCFLWMETLVIWQSALLSLVVSLLLACFGVILKRSNYHDLSPFLLLGASLLIPVVLVRLYNALAPILEGLGWWLPLTQQGSFVLLGIALLTFGMQYTLFATVKSRILSLPVALSWIGVIWFFALIIQREFPDLTNIVAAPNLPLLITIFGGMTLAVWGLLFNTTDHTSTGIWPELVGLSVISGLLAIMTLNLGFLTAALPAQLFYLAATILFGVAGMYIFARTKRPVWGVFSSIFLVMSIFSGWVVLNAGILSGPLTIIGLGVAILGLGVIWQWTHR